MSAFGAVNRQLRSPLARDEGNFLLPKPGKRKILASKSPEINLVNFGIVHVLITGEAQMTIAQISRNIAGAVVLIALTAAANVTSAGEKPVGTFASQRTQLSFKVSDTAVQKLLPQGWEASPSNTGPSKDANLTVVFVDTLSVQNPDGSPGETFRVAALTIPAKKQGTDATVPMVVAGLASPSYAPGPYRAFAVASASVDRRFDTDHSGKSNVEESWEFGGDDGNAIQLQLQYVSGIAVRTKVQATPHSGINPDFYRIYRSEQAADIVRSTVGGTDRVQKYAFKATGAKLAQIFDGTEQLISIVAVPFYTNQISLPEEVTQ
jgi:hypothetical protein